MSVNEPFPSLEKLIVDLGQAGLRMSEIGASEGGAGNISIMIGWEVDARQIFPVETGMDLPFAVPELAGKSFLVTGSGRRLREILQEPEPNLACLTVNDGGASCRMFTSTDCLFDKVTSEFNSHLAVHRDQFIQTGTNFHAVIHAQPPHLTFLSHIPLFQDEETLNHHLLRWQPELIYHLPEGVGFIPFQIPGSNVLMDLSAEGLRRHRVILWARHGVLARSDISIKRAADRIEYAEAGARYEYMNILAGERADGLSLKEMREICEAFAINQTVFKWPEADSRNILPLK